MQYQNRVTYSNRAEEEYYPENADYYNEYGNYYDEEEEYVYERPQKQPIKRQVSDNSNPKKESSIKTRKVFVGGLPHSISLDVFKQYFLDFGNIEDCVIMLDRHTQKPRGFGFVTFETEKAAQEVIRLYQEHFILGQWVECKLAVPGNPSHHPPEPIVNKKKIKTRKPQPEQEEIKRAQDDPCLAPPPEKQIKTETAKKTFKTLSETLQQKNPNLYQNANYHPYQVRYPPQYNNQYYYGNYPTYGQQNFDRIPYKATMETKQEQAAEEAIHDMVNELDINDDETDQKETIKELKNQIQENKHQQFMPDTITKGIMNNSFNMWSDSSQTSQYSPPREPHQFRQNQIGQNQVRPTPQFMYQQQQMYMNQMPPPQVMGFMNSAPPVIQDPPYSPIVMQEYQQMQMMQQQQQLMKSSPVQIPVDVTAATTVTQDEQLAAPGNQNVGRTF